MGVLLLGTMVAGHQKAKAKQGISLLQVKGRRREV